MALEQLLQNQLGLLVIGLCAAFLILVLLVFMALLAARKSARNIAPIVEQMHSFSHNFHILGENQQQLRGSLQTVSDGQSAALGQLIQTVEMRLADVQQNMQERLADNTLRNQRAMSELQERLRENLQGASKNTATSLSALQERLAAIDKAQDNITKLSSDVLGLQDILSNKQTRGAFGEIQLRDILSKALPADSYSWQPTLSNSKRPDCLVHLPNPPGPIVIDSKFPLEAYEALRRSETPTELKAAAAQLRIAVRKHISDISERYIIEGETADGALMFLPSEAVYAELHANFPDIVRLGFEARVWIVSPTTCMATLNTMRAILKDARMQEQASAIRKELGLLVGDVTRLEMRVAQLDRHFAQASKDIEDIKISAAKSGKRAHRLGSFEFDEADLAAVEALEKQPD